MFPFTDSILVLITWLETRFTHKQVYFHERLNNTNKTWGCRLASVTKHRLGTSILGMNEVTKVDVTLETNVPTLYQVDQESKHSVCPQHRAVIGQ